MAKIDWKAPIDAVHGKLYKGFGAAKRKVANAAGEQYNYSVMYGSRNLEKYPVSQDEQAARDKFKAIAAKVATRRKDVSKRVLDQQAFKAQTACKTLTEYLWSVCTTEYNTEHSTTNTQS